MTTSQYSVSDRTAVVTGGSRGIGRAIARNFAEDGANVVICALERDREELEATAADLTEASSNGRAVPVTCDITDRDDVAALADAAVEEFGGIDVLVNNAGGDRQAPFEEFSVEDWNFVIELNINGTFNATQIVGEHIRTDDGGAIVNIASTAGVKGLPYEMPYSIAKAGIVNFTRTLAYEWAHDDVRVNAVAPGITATDLVARLPAPVPEADDIDRETVARRYGKPEEIADIVQMLASPAASYLTGQTISVAGTPTLERELAVAEDDDGIVWNW
ncbi:SDR family NAD(P)-dependent oxidoreductase [Halorarius halobius]|uniref:SDR family NAD(P)-dependent oxidoreductase n=1 Tax=Halorarius halobius TaxID=2962671 RepID=UPI0020CBBE11|nr:SDR family NAD(P)-dependent oxidoreductase [Halorarius halobius]